MTTSAPKIVVSQNATPSRKHLGFEVAKCDLKGARGLSGLEMYIQMYYNMRRPYALGFQSRKYTKMFKRGALP